MRPHPLRDVTRTENGRHPRFAIYSGETRGGKSDPAAREKRTGTCGPAARPKGRSRTLAVTPLTARGGLRPARPARARDAERRPRGEADSEGRRPRARLRRRPPRVKRTSCCKRKGAQSATGHCGAEVGRTSSVAASQSPSDRLCQACRPPLGAHPATAKRKKTCVEMHPVLRAPPAERPSHSTARGPRSRVEKEQPAARCASVGPRAGSSAEGPPGSNRRCWWHLQGLSSRRCDSMSAMGYGTPQKKKTER